MRLLTAGSLVRVQLGEPRRSKLCIACSDFFQKSERAHVAAPPFQTGPAAAGLRFGFWGTLQVLYRHSHHVGASFVSLAPTFFKSQSALTSLLLLSKPDPLPLGSGLVFLLYCKVRFAPAYFYLRKMHISRPRLCSAPLMNRRLQGQ